MQLCCSCTFQVVSIEVVSLLLRELNLKLNFFSGCIHAQGSQEVGAYVSL